MIEVLGNDSIFLFLTSVMNPKIQKIRFERTEKKRWKEIDFSSSVVIKGDGALLERILSGK